MTPEEKDEYVNRQRAITVQFNTLFSTSLGLLRDLLIEIGKERAKGLKHFSLNETYSIAYIYNDRIELYNHNTERNEDYILLSELSISDIDTINREIITYFLD